MNTTGKYVKHGLSKSRVREIWKHMLRRCYRPKTKGYKWYGGRGIKVCERWHELTNFVADMGHPPDGMQLDRINNDGDYEPSNCRWVTSKENNRNRRSNRPIEFRGRTQLISDWAAELGINNGTLKNRLDASGMSVEEAFTRPVGRWARAR